MSHFYLDSSAVVKRYSPESGSAWLRAVIDSAAGHSVILSEITLAEVAAAIAAKHRIPGGIGREERDKALALFLGHCEAEYSLVVVTRTVIDRAVRLTQAHKLRGYDAVQLATALLANQSLVDAGFPRLTFVAADGDLLAAANAEGLGIEDPNLRA